MFASAEMSWSVEGVFRTYFNVLNHIRWSDKESCAKRCNREQLRRYINNSEEIRFAEQLGIYTETEKNKHIIETNCIIFKQPKIESKHNHK